MMPRNFALILPQAESSKVSTQRRALFLRDAIRHPLAIRREAVRWTGVPLRKSHMDLSRRVPVQLDEVLEKSKTQI